MFGQRKNSQIGRGDVILYNLEISLEEGKWQGPFKSLESYDLANIKLKNVRPFLEKFSVLDSGLLVDLSEINHLNYHTFRAGIKFDQPDHIHFKVSGEIAQIELRKIRRGLVIPALIEGYNFTGPVYTLEGLYGTLPNARTSTIISGLVGELQKHGEILLPDNLPKENKEKIVALEEKYRELVSDQ